jgi:hypothetical protein
MSRQQSSIATRSSARWPFGLFFFAVMLVASVAPAGSDFVVSPSALRLVKSQSGPTNYYSVIKEGELSFVRSRYAPPMKTAVLGWQVPDAERKNFRRLRWSWRAQTLPREGDECRSGKTDSAAVVYVSWKRGLRYYTLKYVWSSVGTKGKVCDQKRNPFVAQDTVIVDSGPPLDAWRKVDIDLDHEYRAHFEGGDSKAEVPDFVGIGIMSDGDQTESPSSADFGAFTLSR